MNTPPLQPPSGFAEAYHTLTVAAVDGQLHLPVCQGCGLTHYPPQQTCRNCLGERMVWRQIDGRGTAIETTILNHSLHPYFRERLPWRIATVRLDAGPIVIAHAAAGVGRAMRVCLRMATVRGGGHSLTAWPAKPRLRPS